MTCEKNRTDQQKKSVENKHSITFLTFEIKILFPKYSIYRSCALHYHVKYSTLYSGITRRGAEFSGSGGKQLISLTSKEEKMIKEHILYKARIGYGDSWKTLRMLIQKLLLRIKKNSPERITGLEDQGQRPSNSWVRRFAKRHHISLRKSSIISKGRAVISPKAISLWFKDVGDFFESQPKLLQALQDPNRVFNQDETAIEHGVGNQYVLTMKGEKQTYSVSSSTREHTTISFTVNAAGGMVKPRIVFSGIRDIAKTKLQLPKDGLSGEWAYCYTDNGWVKQSTYLHIINDLAKYIEEHSIEKPVILIMDGASCHDSLEMVRLCQASGIQPILLRPNTTHLTQALDLTFFAALKAGLKVASELWHRDPDNIGSSLSKYTVVKLVHTVTENILKEKPELIGKGFQKAGIVPWNPNAPNTERMAPSLAYARHDDQELPIAQQEKSGDPSAQEDCSEGREPPSTILLPPADSRFHAKFELLLSLKELQLCREIWLSGEKPEHPVYKAWELLKLSSISEEEKQGQMDRQALKAKQAQQSRESQAVVEVLKEHTPKKIMPPKKKEGPNVLEGASRYIPTSPEHMKLLEERSARQKEKITKNSKAQISKTKACK